MSVSVANFREIYDEYNKDDQETVNERMASVDEAIQYLENQPEFCETLLNFLAQSGDDEKYQLFIAIAIKNQVKKFWENDEFYKNKEEFKNNLLQVMINSTGTLLSLISEIITIISHFDFPDKWPALMRNLTSVLNEEQELPTIYAVLSTSSQILKRYERSSSSDPVYRQIDDIVQYWGETLINLFTEILPKQQECEALEDCFNFCFQIIRSLCAIDMPKYILANIDKFFAIYHNFFGLDGCEKIKITLCMIMKQYFIRYTYEIGHWGQSEDDKKSEEEVQNVKELWNTLKIDLLNTLNVTINSEEESNLGDQLVITAFDALLSLARSNERDFFVQEVSLEQFCVKTLIPCVSLSEEDIENFHNDSLHYFEHDIGGLESETKRMSAYSFLKMLQRHFSEKLTSVFNEACQELVESYNQNPDDLWKDMDTAIFIMDIILARVTHYNQGVISTIEDFDLSSFLTSFIIPQLGSKYPLLQADALKFLVNYRKVIDKDMILELFPEIVKLLFNDGPVSLYTAYFIDRIMLCDTYYKDGPILLQNIDVGKLISRLFALFKYGDKLNLIAARCLMRIVTYGKDAISEHIIGIVGTCTNYLSELCKNDLTNPLFNHSLFEIIAAAVTKVNVPVPEIDEGVLKLLDKILSDDISEFVPYVYQIIGCFLLRYPDDALAANSESFYITSYPTFLEHQRWLAMGNIPALAILVQAYCIKIDEIVINNIEPLLEICEHLLQGTRSHPHAFKIFVSIIRFLPNEFTFSIMPRIYEMVIGQLNNPDLKKYRSSFAIFMCDACFFLEPDNAIKLLGENAEGAIACWSESLPLVRGRHELESTIAGCIKTLLEAKSLTQPMWEQLFVGTVKSLESPSYNSIKDDIEVIKIEEQDAKQFDTTFNKLIYAEEKEINPHPELDGVDLVKYMATNLAKYSHSHPGYLADCIDRNLEPHLKNSFLSYQKNYEIEFA